MAGECGRDNAVKKKEVLMSWNESDWKTAVNEKHEK